MRRTGGTIAVTAGIFGTLAAILTLVVALASALEAEKAAAISWPEWGALMFSFATIFLGAICLHARSISAGLLLMSASVCGAILGGAFVALFMALTFAGGAVASYSVMVERARAAPVTEVSECEPIGRQLQSRGITAAP